MLRAVVLFGVMALLLRLSGLPARPGWRLVFGFFGGLGSLVVLSLLSPLTGMLFELNILTVAVSGALGLPGLGCLLVAHFILSH